MNETRPAILLVDDDPLVLRVLAEVLTEERYNVTACARPTDALSAAEMLPFQVIISDYQMPEMLGMEFLNRTRAIQPHASRILITGVRSLDVVVNAINTGEIFRFITKPWVNAELLATVHNGVQRSQLLVANEHLQRDTQRLNAELAKANGQLEKQVATLEVQKRQIDESRQALRANFDRSVELCYRIINTFNPVLGQQTKTAVEICQRMTESQYFTEDQKHSLVVSAWLHDIGLMGLPRNATANQNNLQTLPVDVRQLVHDHPIYGQKLAAFVDSLRGVSETIRAHHERFDGLGYPDGLAGESIPWPARCLAVVAHYVSCGRLHSEAIEDILALSGKAFDPDAVRLFLRCTQAGTLSRQVRDVMIDELSPGMQLARGVYSPSGILLLPEGQELDAMVIGKLRNHSLLTSLPQQLFVFS